MVIRAFPISVERTSGNFPVMLNGRVFRSSSLKDLARFPFCFLLKTFFAPRLIRSPHEFGTTFAGFSNQHLAFRGDNFFDFP